MTKRIPLTLACGDYEITRALKEGAVQPDGIELTVLTEMDSTTRHFRFMHNRDFDMAETSASSYLAARSLGAPVTAIPVFLHRRFRHGFIFINTQKGIKKPTDLIGRKVGLKGYLTTAGLWLRGILEHEYGVPHTSVEYFSELDEEVPFTPPKGLKLTKIADDKSAADMLCTGELDAVLHADLIKPIVERDPRVGRLFPDYKAEEVAYYKKTGIFPIMHVFGLKQEIVDRYPWVPINVMQAFKKAKDIAMQRMENPRIVPLAWYREAWEEQEDILGHDPWEYGLTPRNRHNLDTLAGYAHEQGLTKQRLAVEDLFVSVFQGHKRGDDFKI